MRLRRRPTAADARYAGYRAADRAQPYAKYFKERVDPPQAHVVAAVAAGPVDRALIPPRRERATEFHAPGYSPVETGYGTLPGGVLWVACLTHMPRVEPEMWDWWFAWHSEESARYKLWHPEGHRFSAVGGRRPPEGTVGDARYEGLTSYVDEEIGGHVDQLAIQFVAPAKLGIDRSTFDGTVICGTVGTALLPVNIGQVTHQVRRTDDGAEMRSRFYLNVPGRRSLDLRGIGSAVRRGISLPSGLRLGEAFGADLLRHCGEEMNHLAQFLPELHAEFSGH